MEWMHPTSYHLSFAMKAFASEQTLKLRTLLSLLPLSILCLVDMRAFPRATTLVRHEALLTLPRKFPRYPS